MTQRNGERTKKQCQESRASPALCRSLSGALRLLIFLTLTPLQCVMPVFTPNRSESWLFLNAGISPNPLKTVAGVSLGWGAVWWLLYRMACVQGGDIAMDATALALQSEDERFWLSRCLTAVNLEHVETLPLVWTRPCFTHRSRCGRNSRTCRGGAKPS